MIEIYEVVRQQFTANMDSATKLLFLQDFPKYLDLKSALLSVRRQVIPPDPKLMTDIDVNLPIFLNKDGENIVKADQVLSDGRRIMMFSTNDHLKILARANQILGDGTFRITPGLWCQTFIISAEVSQGSFVPVSAIRRPLESIQTSSSSFKQSYWSSGYLTMTPQPQLLAMLTRELLGRNFSETWN